MTRFEFATATRVVFGAGMLSEAAALTRPFGRHAFIVTGRSADRMTRLVAILSAAGIASTPFAVAGEPDLSVVERGVAAARQAACDFVIGIGGGSAIDAAKAIAALLANDGEVLDFVEVIGRGRALTHPSLPCVTIPTTAGTGSEVTRNAVLASRAHRVKVSLRSPLMLPRLAIVDPELTIDLPPALTASTGLDALTQLIEPYLSCRANPMIDALCVEGMRRIAGALPAVCRDGHDVAARESMALASLFSGMALANAGLGAVHGFAGPIGGMFDAPHGAVCAALLPHVLSANRRAIDARAPGHPARGRFDEVARLLTGRPAATAEDGEAWVAGLVASLEIPGLGRYGITANDVPAVVAQSMQSSSMKGNPIELTPAELSEILVTSL